MSVTSRQAVPSVSSLEVVAYEVARLVSEEGIMEEKRLRMCEDRLDTAPWDEEVIGAAKAAPGREMARRREDLILAD